MIIVRLLLMLFIILFLILLIIMLLTSEKFNFSGAVLISIMLSILFVLGPGWPSKESKEKSDPKAIQLKFISYFLRLFCALISLNFIYSLFTGSIYIGLVSKLHSSKLINFSDSPYIFSLAFIFSGYVFIKSVFWLRAKVKPQPNHFFNE